MLVLTPMAYQSEIEKLEARYRENPQQWFAALADSYRKAGDLDLALDVVRAGLEERPNYVSGHIVLGRCLLDQKNDAGAAQAFRRVLELDAENLIALRALADISRRTGDWGETSRWLRRLLEVDPMNEEAEQELKALEAQVAAVGEAPTVTETVPEAVPAAEPEIERLPRFEPTAAEALEGAETGEPATLLEEATEIAEAGLAGTEAAQAEPIETEVIEPAAPVAGEVSEVSAPLELETTWLESREEGPSPVEGAEIRELLPHGEPVQGAAEPGLAIEKTQEAALEPELEVRQESLRPPEVLVEEEVPLTDLPLILPEEVEEKPPEAVVVSETEEQVEETAVPPEPVFTETMAELYAQQGLLSQARDIYRELVARRPHDARLAGRLAELERAAAVAVSAAKEAKVPLARVTGGESVREFLARVLGRGSESGGTLVGEENPAAGGVEPEAVAEVSGSPTRAAEDEISLAAIFGEEPAPLNPRPSEAPSSRSSGFSFDEFFGAGEESQGGESKPGEADGDDDFARWLKSLKS